MANTMDYIAVLDYEHLDNAMFLNAFARAVSNQMSGSGIIIHGDSSYTDRLMQTGMMREDARKRAVKDLNHRLIALFADNGVAAVGLNAFQKEFISEIGGELTIKHHLLNKLPPVPFLVLSNLIVKDESGTGILPLADLAKLLKQTLDIKEVLVFSMDDSDEFFVAKPDRFDLEDEKQPNLKPKLPKEFHNASYSFRLTTTTAFSNFPNLQDSTLENGEDGAG